MPWYRATARYQRCQKKIINTWINDRTWPVRYIFLTKLLNYLSLSLPLAIKSRDVYIPSNDCWFGNQADYFIVRNVIILKLYTELFLKICLELLHLPGFHNSLSDPSHSHTLISTSSMYYTCNTAVIPGLLIICRMCLILMYYKSMIFRGTKKKKNEQFLFFFQDTPISLSECTRRLVLKSVIGKK